MKIALFVEMAPGMRAGECREAYPEGMQNCLKAMLEAAGHRVTLVEQDENGDGAAMAAAVGDADVAYWWGHGLHQKVSDAAADAVVRAVWRGMGLVCLHSSHLSKPFLRLIGTDGTLCWREAGENERLWVVDPAHPIAAGLPPTVEIEREEMYGEPFGIPQPDELVFLGWYKGGEVFRSGCVFRRGRGKVFYFQPGHETYPNYKLPDVRRILLNAAEYLRCPAKAAADAECPCVPPKETL
ncbi:MAG: ThuA domain-containing protein [Clostridiales bacterium]|jgi:trehalose utilization protein|nr:ThuA domain-containing protein [Clostridiales bacterium]